MSDPTTIPDPLVEFFLVTNRRAIEDRLLLPPTDH